MNRSEVRSSTLADRRSIDGSSSSGHLAIFAACCLPYSYLVFKLWFVCDDAFIAFRYSRNLTLGHGLRYNLGEHVPVEGFSSTLWVLLGAVFESTPLDIVFWTPVVSALCGFVLLYLVIDRMHHRLEIGLPATASAALLLATLPPFACWSTSGLETMAFALAVFVLFDRLLLDDGATTAAASVAGLVVGFIRVEGVAWVAVLVVLVLAFARHPSVRRRALIVLALVLVATACHTGWRWFYYDEVIANTVRAKMSLPLGYMWRGFDYLAIHVLTFVTPAALAVTSWFALRRKRRAIGLPMAAMAWAFPAYALVTGGDWMAMGRFVIPSLPFATVLLGWAFDDLYRSRPRADFLVYPLTAAMLALQLMPVWDIHLVPEQVRAQFHFRHSAKIYRSEIEQWQRDHLGFAKNWSLAGKALAAWIDTQPGFDASPSLVRTAIGAVGYHSNLFIYDTAGLVTPEVARRRIAPGQPMHSAGHDRVVDRSFFLAHKPNLLRVRLFFEENPALAAQKIRKEAASGGRNLVNQSYVRDFARVQPVGAPVPAYLVVMRRIDPHDDADTAWRRLDDAVEKLAQTGEVSLEISIE